MVLNTLLVIVLFFDGFGESNKFGEKSRIKCGTSNRRPHIVPKTFSEGPPGDVLRTFSKESPKVVDLGHPWDVRLGHLWDIRSRRPSL